MGKDCVLQLQHQLILPSSVCESSALTDLASEVLSFYTTVANEGSPNHIPTLLWAMDTPVPSDRMCCITYEQAAR